MYEGGRRMRGKEFNAKGDHGPIFFASGQRPT